MSRLIKCGAVCLVIGWFLHKFASENDDVLRPLPLSRDTYDEVQPYDMPNRAWHNIR